MKTLFERILDKELPATFVYEDADFFAIKDKFPKAPVHLLIIPKKVISDISSLKEEDLPIMGKVLRIAQKLALQFHLNEEGYRLVVNNGAYAGQTIFHLHFHVLGGKLLGEMG